MPEEARFAPEQGAFEAPPVLSLDIDDDKLILFIDNYVKQAKEFYDKKKIPERRELIKRYFFGNQITADGKYDGITQHRKLKSYEKPYVDNVLKEGEDILRPLVLSRMPDLIVNPGTQSQIPRESAESLGEAVNKTLQSDELKKLLTRAFRDHPLNFTAVIKYWWDPNKGKLGDIHWEVISPKNILMDHFASDNDQASMSIIVHFVEKSLFQWIMLFPDKEEELKDYAKSKKGWDAKKDPDGRTTRLKIQEAWFDWQEKAENFDPENPEYKFLSGVLWKVGKGTGEGAGKGVILKKKRNPNWDWEGEDKLFFNGQPVPEEMLPQIAALGFNVQGVERKKVYKNYFGKPRKPFIFMGYEQYGEMPLDETSRIEENLLLQENYDMRGMQISKMIDDAKGKNVYSKKSGLKKKTLEDMDVNDPEEDMLLDGDLREVHTYIKKEQPSNQMFEDLNRTRDRMLAKVHISAPTRGEIRTSTATTNQIARESDYSVADDISSLTINEVATKMAEALLQIMKLRYTPEHFEMLVGRLGLDLQERLSSDIIEDGLEVTIRASGTDKLKTERQAKDEATLGLGDPLSYYKDTGRPDPKQRAEMSFLWQTAPELYYKKFIKGEDVQDIANGIQQQNQQTLANAQGGANPTPVPGGPPNPPLQPSPQNTGNIPTTPQGSPRSLFGRATNAIASLIRR